MSAKKNILLAAGGAAAGLALAQGVILGAHGIGPLKKLQPLRLSRMPGNQENFSLSTVRAAEPNALTGKYLCFLGSSVTKGAASLDVSFAEYLAVRNRCPYKKEAVNGTTIADVGKDSYVNRMYWNLSPEDKFDAFVVQLSTNDARKQVPIGELTEGGTWKDINASTVLGGIETIVSYVQDTWHCPIFFYTNPRFESAHYQKMVDALYEAQKKWGFTIIDLWNDEAFNDLPEWNRKLFMADPIHPTKAGYEKWWTPKFEKEMIAFFENREKAD